MTRFQALFSRVLTRLEALPGTTAQYAQLFVALLFVRLTLEFFSSQRLFTFGDVVHIGLWFVFIVLAYLLQLHGFARVPVAQAFRLVVVCYVFSWSAPLLDLVFTKGHGAQMNYLSLSSWREVAFSYVTVGGSSLVRGATLGIRVEIVLLVAASFNYVRLKTGQVGRAALAALCLYTVLFASGALPALLLVTTQALGLTFTQDDQSTVLLLLSLDLLLLGALLVRHDPARAKALLRSVRWDAVLFGVVFLAVGFGLGRARYPSEAWWTPTTLFWPGLGVALALAFAVAPSLLRGGEAAWPLLAVLAATSALLHTKLLFLTLVLFGVLVLACAPPFELERLTVGRPLSVAAALLCCAFGGFCAAGGPLIGFPGSWLGALGLAGALGTAAVEVRRWTRAARGAALAVGALLVVGTGVPLVGLLSLLPGALALPREGSRSATALCLLPLAAPATALAWGWNAA